MEVINGFILGGYMIVFIILIILFGILISSIFDKRFSERKNLFYLLLVSLLASIAVFLDSIRFMQMSIGGILEYSINILALISLVILFIFSYLYRKIINKTFLSILSIEVFISVFILTYFRVTYNVHLEGVNTISIFLIFTSFLFFVIDFLIKMRNNKK